jgi:uncharacterized protein
MEQRVSVITLGVADLPRSRAFYVDGLGWKPVMDSKEIVFFQLNGLVLGLFPIRDLLADAGMADADPAGRTGGMALGYNVHEREQVDPVIEQAVAAGGRLLKPGQDAFWGGYSGYFSDPDGHLWEVAWNPPWPIDADGNVWFRST